jgi:hypothetical protein
VPRKSKHEKSYFLMRTIIAARLRANWTRARRLPTCLSKLITAITYYYFRIPIGARTIAHRVVEFHNASTRCRSNLCA